MNREGYKDPTAETAISNIEKPWKHMTERDLYKIKKEKCRFCKYSLKGSPADENIGAITCDYIGKTGHSRGCRPDQCDKFKRKTKRGKKRE